MNAGAARRRIRWSILVVIGLIGLCGVALMVFVGVRAAQFVDFLPTFDDDFCSTRRALPERSSVAERSSWFPPEVTCIYSTPKGRIVVKHTAW